MAASGLSGLPGREAVTLRRAALVVFDRAITQLDPATPTRTSAAANRSSTRRPPGG